MDGIHKKLLGTGAAAQAPTVAPRSLWPANLFGGSGRITEEVGLPVRITYHLLRTGVLPGEKIGGKWCSSRSALHKQFAAVLGEVA